MISLLKKPAKWFISVLLCLGVISLLSVEEAYAINVMSWNMQGATYKYTNIINNVPTEMNTWDVTMKFLVDRNIQVMALQETGIFPGDRLHAVQLGQLPESPERQFPVVAYTLPYPNFPNMPANPSTELFAYTILGGMSQNERHLAIMTTQVADEVVSLRNPVNAYNSRPILGVRIGDTYYFTVHASADGGTDSLLIIEAINNYVFTRSLYLGRLLNWVALGDFNRDLIEPSVSTDERFMYWIQAPNSGVTHSARVPLEEEHRILDYMATSPEGAISIQGSSAIYDLRTPALEPFTTNFPSDHFPVLYQIAITNTPVPATPPPASPPPATSVPATPPPASPPPTATPFPISTSSGNRTCGGAGQPPCFHYESQCYQLWFPESSYCNYFVVLPPSNASSSRDGLHFGGLSLETSAIAIRSIRDDLKTSIEFVNHLQESVKVLWVDYKGNEVPCAMLEPGTSYTQPTYVTHPWIVRAVSDNRLVGGIVGSAEKQNLYLGLSVLPSLPEVKNISWSGGRERLQTISWSPAENATEYEVTLLRGDTQVLQQRVNKTSLKYNFQQGDFCHNFIAVIRAYAEHYLPSKPSEKTYYYGWGAC